MKGPLKSAVWLLPLLLTGCFDHHRQTAQIQPLAPPLVEAPPPSTPQVTTAPEPPTEAENKPEPTPEPPPEPEPKRHVRHRKPAPKDNPPPVQVADNSVPALGNISSGDAPNLRQQTQDSIYNTERQLAGIKGGLSDQEKHTIDHIKEFLKQAKQALANGDVDGASTLAQKAQVLLAEVVR
jgi:outer membrane biosynthesis protein TonB